MTVYNAYLTSDLTILKTKNLISKTNDIKNGKIQFQRIGIRSDWASKNYFLREISTDSKDYWQLKS